MLKAQAGAALVALPEYFCLLGKRDTDKLAIAEAPGRGPIQQFLADSARTLGLWIVGGTLAALAGVAATAEERALVAALAARAGSGGSGVASGSAPVTATTPSATRPRSQKPSLRR